jgi:UDP-glucuronate 4-epimerase
MTTDKDTILVTGAAGFVGSNLCKALLEKGFRVVGVDNFDDTYERSLKEEHVAALREHPGFELVELDIRDATVLRQLCERTRPSRIAHLAAKADTRAAVEQAPLYVENNILGTLNVFDAARGAGVQNVVFVSSSSVYGNDTQAPWSESAAADHPLSPYGATKRAGELFAYAYHHNFGLNITCLRYFNVYGEHNRPSMVPYLWARALLRGEEIEISGGGTRKRDYTYVGDTVRATIAALEKPLGFEIINVGNNHPLSLTELLAVFEKVIGTKARVRERASHSASVESTYADIDKAKRLLGWKPQVPIEKGVENLVAWMRASRL